MLRGQQATVNVEDTVTYPFTCGKCQHYCYAQVHAVGVDTARKNYLFDADDAATAARAAAEEGAAKDMHRDGEIVIGLAPCPRCQHRSGIGSFWMTVGIQSVVALVVLGALIYGRFLTDALLLLVLLLGAWLLVVVSVVRRQSGRMRRARSVLFYDAS